MKTHTVLEQAVAEVSAIGTSTKRFPMRDWLRPAFAMLALALGGSAFAQSIPDLVFPKGASIQLKNEDMSAAALTKAQATGVKYVRKGIYWDTIETSAGVYNWTQVDTWVNDMTAKNFSMIITVVWNNRIYEDIWDRAIVTEPGRQAFAGFVAKLVTRYKGKPIIWEIWNEPNLRSFWHENAENKSNTDAMAEEYTALVNVAVPAMKVADPNCKVVAGSISALWTDSFNWFDRCIEMGILTSGIDGISVHPYGFRWPELAMQEGYAVIRQKLDTNGAANMPIINSEVGFDQAYLMERGFTTTTVKDGQAWSYVRQNIVDAMCGVRLTNWYEFTDPSWGVVNNDLSNRPTFTAAQVMTAQLAGYHFQQRIALPSALDYAAVFQNASGQYKLVVWTTPDRTLPTIQRLEVAHTVEVPVGAAGNYVVTDVFGGTSAASTATTELSVTVTGGPKYIPLTTNPAGGSATIVLNFTSQPVSGYSNQDSGGTATVEDAGATLKLAGNTWKKVDLVYPVTANTVLEFDFRSTQQGEVQGMGFDNDNTQATNSGYVFETYGTQTVGNQTYHNYSGTAWKHYTIPVGQHYTGTMNQVVFANDHDVTNANSNSYYRNVTISEGSTGPVDILLEAESLSFTTSDSVVEFNDSSASATKADKLNANAIGDHVTYTGAVPQTGTYNVKVRYKSFPARGQFQLSVNGTNVGPVVDQFGSTSTWIEVDLGNVAITTGGNQTFKFTVTGKNASSSGYDLTVDTIKLHKP